MLKFIKDWWNKKDEPEMCGTCNIKEVELLGVCVECLAKDIFDEFDRKKEHEHQKLKRAVVEAMREIEQEKNVEKA